MKFIWAILGVATMVMANPKPQLPTPSSAPPPLSHHTLSKTTQMSSPPSPDVPVPPATSSKGQAPAPDGPICECGYTYCASVLMAMKKPWSTKQLGEAYCSTPNAACANNTPATNVTSALYVCLCNGVDQRVGTDLDLLCGCDKCLNVGPDFRGRCETPCHAGNCAVLIDDIGIGGGM